MKKYIGVKVVEAEPMTLFEFYEKYYSGKPDCEAHNISGYRVTNSHGKYFWMQKEDFEEFYKEFNNDFIVIPIGVATETGEWNFLRINMEIDLEQVPELYVNKTSDYFSTNPNSSSD